MTNPSTRAHLASIAPFFIVRDLAASLAFYRDALGFEATFVAPANDPFFAFSAELVSRRVPLRAPLADTEDGLRGFEIADPDGYVLFFGRPA